MNPYQEQRKQLEEFYDKNISSLTNEIDISFAETIKDLLLFYCDYSEKENIEFIESYISSGKDVSLLESNELYKTSFKCILITRLISEQREIIYVNLLKQLQEALKENGLNHYDSMLGSLEIFDIRFENGTPILVLKDEGEFDDPNEEQEIENNEPIIKLN